MAQQAKVTSLEALEAFRVNLIIFLNQAHRCVDEVLDEVRRTRVWLQTDQRLHWEGLLRKRRKLLHLAQQELMSTKLSGLRDTTTTQEAAVRKAKQAVAEAEEKLRNIKTWVRSYDHHAEPLTRRVESLRQLLNFDMPKGIAFLLQAQKTLESYADGGSMTAAPAVAPKPAPSETETAPDSLPNEP